MPGLVLSCLVLSWLCFGLAWLGLAGRLELERFVSFSSVFSELSGSIPGKAAKTCSAFAGCLELERFVSFSCLFPELSGSIPGKAEQTCETQHQPVALLGR